VENTPPEEQHMTTRKRKTFDPSLKPEVVRMITEQGQSVRNVSESMDIGQTAIQFDCRTAEDPPAETGESATSPRREDIKKASAFFAREMK
jgi:transposase